MAIEITIPRLGWSMDEGIFGQWLKQDGETVDFGDPLFLLESDKAQQEVESVDEGILHIIPSGPQEGDTVAVGIRVAWLLEEGEDVPEDSSTSERTESVVSEAAAVADQKVPLASPSVRRLAGELGVDLAAVEKDGRITADDVRHAAVTPIIESRSEQQPTGVPSTLSVPLRKSKDRLPAISPRAARLAGQLGLDWTRLTGSGRTGRIREKDVRAMSAASSLESAVAQPPGIVRRVIAERMLNSARATAAVTLTTTLDATHLVGLRKQCKAAGHEGVVPAYHDIIARLAAIALQQHPALNSQWTDQGIVQPEGVHVGIAVDTDAGLLVPVIRNVQSLSLTELTKQSNHLIQLARERKCSVDQLSGGTFTISNLGSFGIEAFTPIINAPETAILGLGAIRREAVVMADDRIEPCDRMTLSLTFDHRVTDGAPAAEFLQSLAHAIENPVPWLMG